MPPCTFFWLQCFARDSKSWCFNLTPPCFFLSLVSLACRIYLELTCHLNGTGSMFLCDCNGLLGTPNLGASISPHHVLFSFLFLLHYGYTWNGHVVGMGQCGTDCPNPVSYCGIAMVLPGTPKSRRFNLTPPCFILLLVSLAWRFNLTPPCFLSSLV